PGQPDQNRGESEALSDLDADVEADNVGDEAILREREILQLGGEPEAVEETEDQDGELRVRLEAEEPAEAVHVLERLVDDREADDRVDQVRIRAHAAKYAGEQRDAVAKREQ